MMLWKDIAFAAVMLVVGLAAVIESLRMPLFGGGQVLSAPGLFPGFVGAIIAALSLIVLGRRLGQLRPGRRLPADQDPDEDAGDIRIVGGAALVVAVSIVLLPLLGFVAAGMLATAGLMLVGLARRPRPAEAALVLGMGLVLPFAVHLLFTRVFLTPLP